MALGMYNPDDNNDLYNPTNNNKYKRDFNMIFINSRLLASNHYQKDVDLSVASCGYPIIVKLNQSLQLDLFDLKPVCIIKAILLAVTLF